MPLNLQISQDKLTYCDLFFRYLLLPAFMGFFTERKTVKKMEDRGNLVKESKVKS